MKKFFRRHTNTEGGVEQNVVVETSGKKDWFLPASILIAALLISGSVVYTAGKKSPENGFGNRPGDNGNAVANNNGQGGGSVTNMQPITGDDYVRGNPKARVKIVEYSDLECPFCKTFHYTLKQVISNYGNDVAWVFRHAPLDQLHSKARKEAEALECAGDLGGNDKFWEYMDRLMELTPSNNGLDLAQLPQIAEYVGLNKSKFDSCLASGKFSKKVQSQLDNAVKSGFQGTPFSILVVDDVPIAPISGALPFTETLPGGQKNLKQILDEALKNL